MPSSEPARTRNEKARSQTDQIGIQTNARSSPPTIPQLNGVERHI